MQAVTGMGARNWLWLAALLLLSAQAHADSASITHHHFQSGDRSFDYTAEAGRISVEDDASDKGSMFYTAYSARGSHRPVTFLWNGGPGANSAALHFEAFGPRRLAGGSLVDNSETLLTASDLVFVDPIGTGFSRTSQPGAKSEFYSTLGDFAAMTDFVQKWLEAHHAGKRRVYLVGESFGVWRAAAVTEELEQKHQPVAGIVLISGGTGTANGVLPRPLSVALRTPGRAATALFHGKLPGTFGTDRDAIVNAATQWAETRYAPALERVPALSDAERRQIAAELALWTGLDASQIDEKTLAVSPRQYLRTLLKGKTLDTFDMRRTEEPKDDSAPIIAYFKTDLAYTTPLAYVGLGDLTADPTAPAPGTINENWNYNSAPITPEVMAAAQAGEGPPGAQPWALRALALDSGLKVLVAAGLYDSLNSCAANDALQERLDTKVRVNFTMKCYAGGHMMYRDPAAHVQLSADLRAFVSGVAHDR
jgi:carboxypeptidase C (cathepsin A)